MWQGHEPALARYLAAMCGEWESRGHKDNVLAQVISLRRVHFGDRPHEYPPWFGLTILHENHRARLLEKDYNWYKKRGFGPTPDACGNLWPVTFRHGKWVYMEDAKVVAKVVVNPTHELVTEAMNQCSYCHFWWNKGELNEAGRCPTCVGLAESIDMIAELKAGDQESRELAKELAEQLRLVITFTRQGRIQPT